jgi:hypothetical protein
VVADEPATEVRAEPPPPRRAAIGRNPRPAARTPVKRPAVAVRHDEPDAGAAPPRDSRKPAAASSVRPSPATAAVAISTAPSPAPGRPAVAPATATAASAAQGTLDAVASILRVSVDGPLPTSELESAISRVTADFRACYRAAARKVGKTPALTVKISFVVDEGRAVRNARVTASGLPLAGCMRAAVSKIRTRVAPDVGIATVAALVRFAPTR